MSDYVCPSPKSLCNASGAFSSWMLAPTNITSSGTGQVKCSAPFPGCSLSSLLSLFHTLPQRHGRLPHRSMSALLLLLNLWEWLFIVCCATTWGHPSSSSKQQAYSQAGMEWQQWARQIWHPQGGRGLQIFTNLPILMSASSRLPAVPGTGVAEGASYQFTYPFSLCQITTSTASQWSYLSLLELKLQISYIILKYSKSYPPYYIYISAPHFQCGSKWEIKSIPSLDHCLSTQQSPWDSSQC